MEKFSWFVKIAWCEWTQLNFAEIISLAYLSLGGAEKYFAFKFAASHKPSFCSYIAR